MRTLVLAATLALFAGSGNAGGKSAGHPHFDDGGTLSWHTQLSAAQAQAKKESKLVFIEYGRER